ncbi:sigma-70 family RNA polymerase sigma factor [Ferroacidibacillus organovorans]|uniref:RNA polymerase sigma-70 region 4 domain-containing protein n=1 Tax=Ferroacidibacillus organovorans TaxID=1765683 RepID=A0A101XQI5_9BACL|nr:sigma-70 family RNA polymerase sigma factor [Ferroacidibacillus organovorans]KUO95702.1 hypothetical protein ATW55_13205 [Ferroacidibacillus organovorans]
MFISVTEEHYIKKLAYRWIQRRQSGSIDQKDLESSALLRWIECCKRYPELAGSGREAMFRETVKGAMRDTLRKSSPVKMPRKNPYLPITYVDPSFIDERVGNEPALDRDLYMDVLHAIRNIPKREQIILSLHIEEGLTMTEIAEVLSVSVATVSRSYRSAIEQIRKSVQKIE